MPSEDWEVVKQGTWLSANEIVYVLMRSLSFFPGIFTQVSLRDRRISTL